MREYGELIEEAYEEELQLARVIRLLKMEAISIDDRSDTT